MRVTHGGQNATSTWAGSGETRTDRLVVLEDRLDLAAQELMPWVCSGQGHRCAPTTAVRGHDREVLYNEEEALEPAF